MSKVGLRKSGIVKEGRGRLTMFEDIQAWSRMLMDGTSRSSFIKDGQG